MFKGQVGAWQLISVNINRQCSSAISMIVEKLLTLVCAHTHLPVIFSIQETRSWDVPNLEWPGYVIYIQIFLAVWSVHGHKNNGSEEKLHISLQPVRGLDWVWAPLLGHRRFMDSMEDGTQSLCHRLSERWSSRNHRRWSCETSE